MCLCSGVLWQAARLNRFLVLGQIRCSSYVTNCWKRRYNRPFRHLTCLCTCTLPTFGDDPYSTVWQTTAIPKLVKAHPAFLAGSNWDRDPDPDHALALMTLANGHLETMIPARTVVFITNKNLIVVETGILDVTRQETRVEDDRRDMIGLVSKISVLIG